MEVPQCNFDWWVDDDFRLVFGRRGVVSSSYSMRVIVVSLETTVAAAERMPMQIIRLYLHWL